MHFVASRLSRALLVHRGQIKNPAHQQSSLEHGTSCRTCLNSWRTALHHALTCSARCKVIFTTPSSPVTTEHASSFAMGINHLASMRHEIGLFEPQYIHDKSPCLADHQALDHRQHDLAHHVYTLA